MHRQLLRFTFSPANVGEPVVYEIGREFGIVTNILRANITRDSGWAILELLGDAADVQSAIAWARNKGVLVEEVAEELVD